MQAIDTGTSPSGITRRWAITSGNVPDGVAGEAIGHVSWYAPWRRYVMTALPATVLDAECMRTLADFCERKTREHKAARG
jgi:hypothetical protein